MEDEDRKNKIHLPFFSCLLCIKSVTRSLLLHCLSRYRFLGSQFLRKWNNCFKVCSIRETSRNETTLGSNKISHGGGDGYNSNKEPMGYESNIQRQIFHSIPRNRFTQNWEESLIKTNKSCFCFYQWYRIFSPPSEEWNKCIRWS